MTDTIERPKTEKLIEPAKLWRNKWRALAHCRCELSGRKSKPGDIVVGLYAHPGKDICETHAVEEMAEDMRRYGRLVLKYLGAFPVTP